MPRALTSPLRPYTPRATSAADRSDSAVNVGVPLAQPPDTWAERTQNRAETASS